MNVISLKYSSTNTYIIEGDRGRILFDTGWAGKLDGFFKACKDAGISAQDIDYILISHFHPDHCGLAGEIASLGSDMKAPGIIVMDVQKDSVHCSDHIFEKEDNKTFMPVSEDNSVLLKCADSREFLAKLGIPGEILHTPGHSDDSISLILDEGSAFVGDLNPLYELELHRGTLIEDSWNRILAYNPRVIYYGHAKSAELTPDTKTDMYKSGDIMTDSGDINMHALAEKVIKYTDKGWPAGKISRKTGAELLLVEKMIRMYLTHQDISIQGILDRL